MANVFALLHGEPLPVVNGLVESQNARALPRGLLLSALMESTPATSLEVPTVAPRSFADSLDEEVQDVPPVLLQWLPEPEPVEPLPW